MRCATRATCAVLLGLTWLPQACRSEVPVTPAAAPVSLSDDKLLFMGNGSTLTPPNGTPCDTSAKACSGGGGGSLTWLHNFNPDALFSVGGEYETIANSHWSFGSLTGALGGGSQSAKWNAYAEAHVGSGEGAGISGSQHWDYEVYALGVAGTFDSKVTLQVETRQYDIDLTHGNLPKVNVNYLVTPRLMLGAAYAHSVSGNLGTDLTSVRLDQYNPGFNWFIGGAFGHVSPAIIIAPNAANPQGVFVPSPSFREGLAGISKTFARTEWGLLGDFQKVGDTKRVIITLTCTWHLHAPARPG